MPCSIHYDFYSKNRRAIPGGLYILSTPESKKYRPERGLKRAFKVGSSWDLGKRVNSYLLSFPWSDPAGLEMEAVLLMNQAVTDTDKKAIESAEDYVHKQLHALYPPARNYPGFKNGKRLMFGHMNF